MPLSGFTPGLWFRILFVTRRRGVILPFLSEIPSRRGLLLLKAMGRAEVPSQMQAVPPGWP